MSSLPRRGEIWWSAWRHNHGSETAVQEFLDGYGTHPDLPLEMIDALVWVRRLRSTITRATLGQNVGDRVAELARALS